MRTEEPHAIHLKDYRPNDYRIGEIALTFDLDMEKTRVTAISEVERQGVAGAPLVLNGEHLALVSVTVNGKALAASDYKKDDATFLAVGGPATARPALQRGTIDTYLAIEPLPSIFEAKGEGRVLFNLGANQGPEMFHDLGYNGWWASTSTIEKKPEVVQRFVKAMEDSYCWYSDPANFDQVVAVMQQYTPVPELSVDGKTFGSLGSLRIATADGKTRAAAPADVRVVRWHLAQPVAPGGEGQVAFRALLK